jgi:hypothetical protein
MKKAAPFGVAFFVFNPWDLGYFGRMKHAPIVLCLLFGFLLSRPALAQTSDEVELYLFDLPGVQFEAVPAPAMFESSWTLLVQQPLDHEHPELGSFRQKVYVSHFESDRPVVLVTEETTPANWLQPSVPIKSSWNIDSMVRAFRIPWITRI